MPSHNRTPPRKRSPQKKVSPLAAQGYTSQALEAKFDRAGRKDASTPDALELDKRYPSRRNFTKNDGLGEFARTRLSFGALPHTTGYSTSYFSAPSGKSFSTLRMAPSPDSKYLAIGVISTHSKKQFIIVVNLQDPASKEIQFSHELFEQRFALSCHSASAFAFTPDSKFLMIVAGDTIPHVQAISLKRLYVYAEFDCQVIHQAILDMQMAPAQKRQQRSPFSVAGDEYEFTIAVECDEQQGHMSYSAYGSGTGQFVQNTTAPTAGGSARVMCFASKSGMIDELKKLPYQSGAPVTAVAYSTRGDRIVFGGNGEAGGTLRVHHGYGEFPLLHEVKHGMITLRNIKWCYDLEDTTDLDIFGNKKVYAGQQQQQQQQEEQEGEDEGEKKNEGENDSFTKGGQAPPATPLGEMFVCAGKGSWAVFNYKILEAPLCSKSPQQIKEEAELAEKKKVERRLEKIAADEEEAKRKKEEGESTSTSPKSEEEKKKKKREELLARKKKKDAEKAAGIGGGEAPPKLDEHEHVAKILQFEKPPIKCLFDDYKQPGRATNTNKFDWAAMLIDKGKALLHFDGTQKPSISIVDKRSAFDHVAELGVDENDESEDDECDDWIPGATKEQQEELDQKKKVRIQERNEKRKIRAEKKKELQKKAAQADLLVQLTRQPFDQKLKAMDSGGTSDIYDVCATNLDSQLWFAMKSSLYCLDSPIELCVKRHMKAFWIKEKGSDNVAIVRCLRDTYNILFSVARFLPVPGRVSDQASNWKKGDASYQKGYLGSLFDPGDSFSDSDDFDDDIAGLFN